MKIKLLIIISAIGLPMCISAQKSTVFLYNKGVMSVTGTDPAKTTLYINGNFVTGGDKGATTHCDVTLNSSKTVLTGDFLHNDLADNATVFNANSTASSVFEFRGTYVQNIKSEKSTYAEIPNKRTSYINFPTLNINNDLANGTLDDKATGAVMVDPAMALAAKTINLNSGWMVLQSVIVDDTNKGKYFASDATATAAGKRTAIANLKLDPTVGKINYNGWDAANPWSRGVIEVDLALRTATEAANTANTNRPLTAFGSPFKELYYDYFMWNFVLAPTADNVFGPGGKLHSDPTKPLVPGNGYILGIDLRGSAFSSYKWDMEYPDLAENNFNNRAKDGYKFNRSKYAAVNNGNNIFGKDVTLNAYKNEILNGQEDVQVKLSVGYNYIANPYTAPLNVTEIITGDGVNRNSDWKIISGPAGSTAREIRNRVWILDNNSSTGTASTAQRDNSMTVDLKYFLAKADGGTYITEPEFPSSVIIPPLQMFLVYAEKEATITIPRSKQIMGSTTFMRSANVGEVDEFESYDDFLFEVEDNATGARDRASVVLRTGAEMLKNSDLSNDSKIKSKSDLSESTVTQTADEDGLDNGFSSLVYTKSEDGNKLLTSKFIPYMNYQTKVTTTLFVKPSDKEQSITIKGLRLGSLREFDEVKIVDKLTGNSKILTEEDNLFPATTKPTDSADRFTLVFNRSTTGVDDEEITNNKAKNISSYYANGTLTVTGFDEADFGSALSVYDIQGKLIKQASVNDFTVNVTHSFVPGAYIVKVVGNNSYVAKFLVK